MPIADQGMKLGLRALNAFASLDLLDRLHAREPAERLFYRATKGGTRTATRAGRAWGSATKLARPARQGSAQSKGLFDITPSDEQDMLRESFASFAADKLRKAAYDADAACSAPDELMAAATELGITMVGVPEELGGVFDERSATTSVLIAETLAHGDAGLAVAALAPAAVSTALSLWGDEGQQARYLPAFTGDEVPAAALALLEPRPLFDPMHLETKANRDGDGFVLHGVKSLVPRAAECELFVVAADLDGEGPALFIVEAGADGLSTEPEPAMGIRAASTAKLHLRGARLEAGSLLAGGDRAAYAECVQRARIAWCAVAVGVGKATLDYVIPYVNERVAFGEPISNRQAVAFTVANMGIELEGMRLATYRAASLADRGMDFARPTAVARELCRTKGARIGSDAVGLLGGHGYVKEYPVERWYRDLRAAGVIEGGLLV
jgi:alkylation response protein AidB-like acyl-CoA dehydrogenase